MTPPTIYATVAAMIAPALFLTATASLMISTATRMARIVDRIRILVLLCDRPTPVDEVIDFPDERRKHAIEELRRLQNRSDRVMAAVTLLYMAFGSFAATSMVIAVDSMTGHRFTAVPTLFAFAGVAFLLAASMNLVVEARSALKSNDLEVQFFFELERLRGDPVIDASAGPDHRRPTDPASRHAEPVRDDALGRSEHGT
jgi:hypothetical protein